MAIKNTRKVGRPSPYKKEYAAQLKKYINENWQEGASWRSFAIILNVHPDTLSEWSKVHLEFSAARQYSEVFEEKFWVDLLIKAGTGKAPEITETSTKINYKKNGDKTTAEPQYQFVNKRPAKMSVAAIMFALKNKFPDRWKDKQEIDMTSVTEGIEQMSDEELINKRKKLEERLTTLRKKHGKDST
jgi:hypothetical protein